MIEIDSLLHKLEQVEKIANLSKFQRMLLNPVKFVVSIIYRDFLYQFIRIDYKIKCDVFFDEKFKILFPSSIDILLTKGKSHKSEIRLAKFLIKNLKSGNTFIDIGAHFGYFSLLAAKIMGSKGSIFAFEPSRKVYSILEENASKFTNIISHNCAVGDSDDELDFYEFPSLYSEYSSMDIEQYQNEKWLTSYKPKLVKTPQTTLDNFIFSNNIEPSIIKIDVEGAEYNVLKGASTFLKESNPILIIEYLNDNRNSYLYKKAENFLLELGFSSFVINQLGFTTSIKNISQYLSDNHIDSENIIFMR